MTFLAFPGLRPRHRRRTCGLHPGCAADFGGEPRAATALLLLHRCVFDSWLDRADGYAYMAGLYGQLAAVVLGKDLVAVTAHLPATVDATAVTRWLLEKYILPAAE